jgi:hypothetical protein
MGRNTVEPPFNILQFKVLSHLTFSFNDPRSIFSVKLPPFKIFLSLMFKFTALNETLNGGFTVATEPVLKGVLQSGIGNI